MLFWATWYHWLVTGIVYFLMSAIGASICYHRLLSHKSFEPHSWFRRLSITLGHMAGIGSAISWVATHRAHHSYTDHSKLDPHSPHHHSWYKVLWFSMFERVDVRLVRDLLRDSSCVWWHKYYFIIHITVLAALWLLSPAWAMCAYLAPMAITWSMGGALNFVNHFWGYRNYETRDESRNNWFFALVYWGEGWHNNHHANPKKFCFGERSWEFDVSAWIIKHICKS
jgi:stearoyl-CoA desaturase (delta-9 desaturase)